MSEQIDIEADYEKRRAELLESGYRDVEEFRGLKVGARVRHRGERYPEAYTKGTAVVRAVLRKEPSDWEASYGHPDVELLVQRDKPKFDGWSPIHQWADYHTDLVGGAS